MLSLYEILKASKTGIAPDMWTALAGMNWGGADSGHEVKELTGIPPLSFTADGTSLLDYLISGNMVQTGTPTSTTPIQPQECGERTSNLCPMVFSHTGVVDDNGGVSTYSQRLWTAKIPVSPSQSYYVAIDGTASNDEVLRFNRAIQYDVSGTFISRINTGANKTATFTTTANCAYIVLDIRTLSQNVNISDTDVNTIQMNVGSEALPYEPYGFKIPISSANTTTPVYLGEVETTRKIGKLVLTGNENWVSKGNPATFRYLNSPILDDLNSVCYCSHFKNLPWAQVQTTNNSFAVWFTSAENTINIRCEDYSTVEDFKAFLSTQYQNGTPVIIWYVLEEPTTGIVNEPLRKIGDYADTVSYEQAAVQIPTNRGNTVIDVLTELKPSEMYIKYQE